IDKSRVTCVKWFSFSPDGKFLACVSQDGFLRVFNFDAVELHGTMKSYFGGLLCVCWSPDGKYIFSGSDEDFQDQIHFGRDRANSTQSRLSKRNSTDSRPVSVTYRFGSVGQDTQLCLWDLTEDILFPHLP
uniref:Uncharacterized protein n=1 Tax=Cyprinus carpio TaxID=7962 RepID=A0A8C1LWJ5_CYPCA